MVFKSSKQRKAVMCKLKNNQKNNKLIFDGFTVHEGELMRVFKQKNKPKIIFLKKIKNK